MPTLRDYVTQQAETLGIPGSLALALVDTESSGQQDAVSPKGAMGLFQLMPATAKSLGVDATDPFQNIDGGLKYLKSLIDAHGGDVRLGLAAYNGGPKAVVNGQIANIPETQAYVQKVLSRWQGGAGDTISPAGGGVAPSAATPPPAASGPVPTRFAARMPAADSPATPARAGAPIPPTPDAIVDTASRAVAGAKATFFKTVYGGGDLLRRATGAERIINTPQAQARMTAPPGRASQIGQFGMEALEFGAAGKLATAAAELAPVVSTLTRIGLKPTTARIVAAVADGGANAAAAATVAKANGDDPESAATIAAALPVASRLITEMAPAIRTAAVTRMARFMERGVRGDVTPTLEKSLAQAASDFIDLPLQRTWRQTARMTRGIRTKAGQSLEQGLAGPLGDTPVPVQPVIDGLDALIADATHLVPAGAGGELRTLTYKTGIKEAVGDLKSLLQEYSDAYGGAVPARQLHDLKQIWWKAVYPIREANQPVASVKELLTSVQKEAHLRGAAEIGNVLKSNAPDLARLDDAVAHAARMDQFIKRLSTKARVSGLAKPAAKYAVGALGGATGLAAGSAVGHPFIGAHIGYAASRMLLGALESPKWRLLPIAARRNLANAIATGNADAVRKIVQPLWLAATAEEDSVVPVGRGQTSSAAAAAVSANASR